jgi:cytidylate kinase
MIITIDGPSGTGKTTIAKRVAQCLNFSYFETGAMYRAITWLCLQKGVDISSEAQVKELLKEFTYHIEVAEGDKKYFVGQTDVTQAVRSKEVTAKVSTISAMRSVREEIWSIQRAQAIGRNAVFEGRDMGTVVFPDAELKIFLTASARVRAERRLKELQGKANGHSLDPEKMLEDINRRDTLDSTREIAPLRQAEDAHLVDTSNLTIDQVVSKILSLQQKIPIPKKKKPSLIYRFVICSVKLFFKLFYRHKVYGLEHFFPGGALISSNHTSFYDPPILAISWPEEVHFLARETLFKHPLFGRFIYAINARPVKGTAKDIVVFKTICNLLSEDKKIIIFPEGTRSYENTLGEVKPGISFFVCRTQKAIVPAYIDGAYEVWNRKRKFPKLFGKTACVFGSPILSTDFDHLDKKETEQAIAIALQQKIQALRQWFNDGAQGTPP